MKEYIEALKSSKPAPGGGSVTGVLTELSAALLHMACAVSYESQSLKDPSIADKLKELNHVIDATIEKAEMLAQEDEKAYLSVSKAFKMASSTEEEKAKRKEEIQTTCMHAAEVPSEVIALAGEIIDMAMVAEHYVNASILSDVAVVVCTLQAAARASLYLVHANLVYMDFSDAARVYQVTHERFNRFSAKARILQERLDANLLKRPSSKEGV